MRLRCGLVFWLLVPASAGAITLVSVQEEVEIGKQVNAQVRREVPSLGDTQTNNYLRALGQQLTRVAPGPKYPYSFAVADYREINAFALPGGPVWIHRGVLHAAKTEAQVVGVLSHEIAHVAQRHAADQLTKAMVANWGLSVLGAVLGNTGGAGAAQVAAGFLANGVFMKFSRDDEREADRVGLHIMRRAGWDPKGMIDLFEMLQGEQRADPGKVAAFFSSHPSPQDRATRLQAEVARAPGGRRDSLQFRTVKARLLRMPAPKAMPRG